MFSYKLGFGYEETSDLILSVLTWNIFKLVHLGENFDLGWSIICLHWDTERFNHLIYLWNNIWELSTRGFSHGLTFFTLKLKLANTSSESCILCTEERMQSLYYSSNDMIFTWEENLNSGDTDQGVDRNNFMLLEFFITLIASVNFNWIQQNQKINPIH